MSIVQKTLLLFFMALLAIASAVLVYFFRYDNNFSTPWPRNGKQQFAIFQSSAARYNQDGTLAFSLIAQEMRGNNDDNQIHIVQPQFHYLSKTMEELNIRANSALWKRNENALILEGQSTAQFTTAPANSPRPATNLQNLILNAETISLNTADRSLTIPVPVAISLGNDTIHAGSLRYNDADATIHLSDGVDIRWSLQK